jgi:hypothetical protein
MTVIGAVALSWDEAIAWADTEVYARGEAVRQCCKLVNRRSRGSSLLGLATPD